MFTLYELISTIVLPCLTWIACLPLRYRAGGGYAQCPGADLWRSA